MALGKPPGGVCDRVRSAAQFPAARRGFGLRTGKLRDGLKSLKGHLSSPNFVVDPFIRKLKANCNMASKLPRSLFEGLGANKTYTYLILSKFRIVPETLLNYET